MAKSAKTVRERSEAPKAVRDQVKELIAKHHPSLKESNGCKIAVWFDSNEEKHGSLDMGRSMKVPDLIRLVCSSNSHFIILLVKPVFDRLSEEQQTALLDRRLCACCFDGMKPTILKPDTTGYYKAELMRHGPWAAEVENVAEYVQGALPGMDAAAGVADAVGELVDDIGAEEFTSPAEREPVAVG